MRKHPLWRAHRIDQTGQNMQAEKKIPLRAKGVAEYLAEEELP